MISLSLIGSVESVYTGSTNTTIWDEPFTTDSSFWTTGTNPAFSGGNFVITPTTSYNRRRTAAAYDLTSRYLKIDMANMFGATPAATMWVQLRINTSTDAQRLQWGVSSNGTTVTLTAARYDAANTGTTVGTATYNATTHRYLRIREQSGTLYWEYSSDAVTWTSIGSVTLATWGYAVTALYVDVGSGLASGTASSNPTINDMTLFGAPSGGGGGGGSSSPPAMPTGSAIGQDGYTWTQIYAEDLNTDIALGSMVNASSGSSTLATGNPYINSLHFYPPTYQDTSRAGIYDPSKSVSISGGVMKIHQFYDSSISTYIGAAPVPIVSGNADRLYMRNSVAFRVTHGSPMFKTAWLTWPTDGLWPDHGEIDFPEMNTNATVGAFHHYARPKNPDGSFVEPHQDGYTTSVDPHTDGLWHIATMEWRSGNIWFILDGTVIGHSTFLVPSTSMHWVLQTETNLDGYRNTAETSDLEIAWMCQWT